MSNAPVSFITVESIYSRYHLPTLLQTHLWRTASLMELLLRHWQGPPVDHALLIETMLVHDLANLVKFDLSETSRTMMFSAEELVAYRQLQAEWHQTYGRVVDEVTVTFLKELRLANTDKISQLILTHTSGTERKTVEEHNWAQKLCDYTDFRIAPHGLVTLRERFDDLGKRYGYRSNGWDTPAKVTQKLQFFEIIEHQLQQHLDVNLQQLQTADLEPLERWQSYHLRVIPE